MILITGATGHVGNNLVHALAEEKESLRLFLQPDDKVDALNGIEFECRVGDITDYSSVSSAMEGVDYVYHLAGLVDISPKNKKQLEAVNVNGTENVVRACIEHGVKRLVYVSSVHAIPEPPKGTEIKEAEREAFPNEKLLGPYARSKSLATAAVYAGMDKGLDAVLLFPSGIIGPGDYRSSEMGKVISYLIGKRKQHVFACFEGAYNFVDVRDMAKAMINAMKFGRSGEGYIIAGHTMTIPDLYRMVLKAVGTSSVRLILFPVKLVKFAAKIVLGISRIFKKKPFFTPYSIDVLNSNSDIDSSKSKKELGFKSRPLEDTIRETVEWMNKYGKKKNRKRKNRAKA